MGDEQKKKGKRKGQQTVGMSLSSHMIYDFFVLSQDSFQSGM
jgi:hypothetical protein